MTTPRRIVPGKTWKLSRRCGQRQFLLRPDAATNNAFLYCLIEAAQKFGIRILVSQMMSNHHHTDLYDPAGNVVEFYQRFHTHLAKCINALRSRCENVWTTAPPSLVELVGVDDVVDKVVYTATNPVKDGLVERTHHWPGPPTVAALFTGQPLRATRPWYLFRADGPMPDSVEMTFGFPAELGDPVELLERVRAGCAAVEQAAASERARTRRQVVGRRRVLRQSWQSAPETTAPRGMLNPRVAARSKWVRIEALQRNREFLRAYAQARARWLAGKYVVFPAGTYWLRRFAKVPTESADPPITTAN